MLPVTDSLENSVGILENSSKELIHVGDCNKNDIGFVTKDDIDRKELATMVRIAPSVLINFKISVQLKYVYITRLTVSERASYFNVFLKITARSKT